MGMTMQSSDNTFRLPDLGEGVHEGQVIRLFVKEGEHIDEDAPLMEVETDKAAVEIPSPVSAVVQTVHVAEDEVVHVGDVMITFQLDGAPTSTSAPREDAPATNEPAPTPHPVVDVQAVETNSSRRIAASPAVRKLARRLGLELSTIPGSGPGGRITRADVEHAAEQPSAPTNDIVSPPAIASDVAETNRASNVGALSQPVTPPPSLHAPMSQLPGTPDQDAWGNTSRLPISRPRRVIAQTMMQSWTTIPHVTDCDDADVTELNAMRQRFNAADATYGKVSLLPFVVRAIALALRRHPIFNASFDTEREEIVYHDYINVAVGVQTERGLVAPVLRDADRFGVIQLHCMLQEMTQRVRDGQFEVNDLRGGTFTISNAGAMGGSRYATPIINPPQVAVLAVGRSKKMPWVVDDAIVPRLIMPLSLSFDHRIIDGAEEIAFQRTIVGMLENPVHFM